MQRSGRRASACVRQPKRAATLAAKQQFSASWRPVRQPQGLGDLQVAGGLQRVPSTVSMESGSQAV